VRLGRHQDIQLLRSLLRRELVVHHVPVKMMCGQKLLKVKTSGLLQEFRLTGVSGVIIERYQYETRQGDDLACQLENSGGSLDLSLEPVRGGTEPERKGKDRGEFRNLVVTLLPPKRTS